MIRSTHIHTHKCLSSKIFPNGVNRVAFYRNVVYKLLLATLIQKIRQKLIYEKILLNKCRHSESDRTPKKCQTNLPKQFDFIKYNTLWPPLKRITLCRRRSDLINRIIQLTEVFVYCFGTSNICLQEVADSIIRDPIMRGVLH